MDTVSTALLGNLGASIDGTLSNDHVHGKLRSDY
jgi:hypothetical protein